ncbi:heme-binding protein [Leucobacter allii]|uniref:Heme-binding protein n=1 Tax=Leucobacter allii TaxID=2932247 RepID=A0ABY4FJK2_9MICO|nr:heme-binding protein [Leucobacter allii]UOQ56223.1 heme-binding protein [Leucobacter allii]UOR00690.1 heme-binding protein [Leucobacter allii]
MTDAPMTVLADPAVIAEEFAEALPGTFTHADAIAVGEEIVRLARSRDLAVAVSVMLGDHEVFRLALPGTSTGNDAWIRRKRNVAELTGEPSFLVGQRLAARGLGPVTPEMPEADYAPHGGAVPILVDGALLGSVTVSGLPPQDDHALVLEALRGALPR